MPEPPEQFLQKTGNYRALHAYRKAEVIYDFTFRFCENFLKTGDRTRDQMIQAARSGKQNIAEGSKASVTSTETEIKLMNVARASLEELLLDYQDFLRVRDLPKWDKNSREVSYVRKLGSNPIFLSLYVEDHHFPAEIAWMGHGLQMWLQMIWFLSRAEDHETVILDEPDVYMHADLQRRLVRFVRNRHQQVIIATHSSEIMAEILPDNILVVDRSRQRSDFASSLPAVQRVLTGFGSVHNLQLSRLWSARRFLMVEGEDVALLKQFQNKLFPETCIPIDTIPATSGGGGGGWNQAVGSDMLLKNAGGDGIVTYSIFDSDYHPTEAIRTRYNEAKQRGLSLHVWQRKELENYLLVATAIRRAVSNQLLDGIAGPSLADVENKLEGIAEELKQDVIDCVATHVQSADRKLTVATANQRAREVVSSRWKTHEDRMGVIPGKEAVSQISRWAQEKYKVSVSGLLIAHNMTPVELPQELREVLTAIEECEAFPERKCDDQKKKE